MAPASRVCSKPGCPAFMPCAEHARPNANARGYGPAHRKVRAQLMQSVEGTACARCGKPMHQGDALHLDHDDTRAGYLGMSHARCNTSAGGRASQDPHRQ